MLVFSIFNYFYSYLIIFHRAISKQIQKQKNQPLLSFIILFNRFNLEYLIYKPWQGLKGLAKPVPKRSEGMKR